MTPNRNSLQMPATDTPPGILGTLVALALLLCALLFWLLGFWGVIVALVIFAFTTGQYTETVPGFFARIVLNDFTGKQRTIFQGFHPKLPWENVTRDIDLKVDLKEVCQETYASQDALMETKYVYTLRPTFDGESVILYASYEPNALKQSIRALFSMLLSDYFGKHIGQDLLDKGCINREVFGQNPGSLLISEFERDHGAKVTVLLESSGFNQQVQKYRNMISGARSFNQIVEILVKDGTGMTKEEAEKVAKLMNLGNVSERIFTVSVKGVPKLRDVAILGGGLDADGEDTRK